MAQGEYNFSYPSEINWPFWHSYALGPVGSNAHPQEVDHMQQWVSPVLSIMSNWFSFFSGGAEANGVYGIGIGIGIDPAIMNLDP
jgi:hypothetical protein